MPTPRFVHFVISIKANWIDPTASPEAVFVSEVKKMQQEMQSSRSSWP